jgi:hypothetical protein
MSQFLFSSLKQTSGVSSLASLKSSLSKPKVTAEEKKTNSSLRDLLRFCYIAMTARNESRRISTTMATSALFRRSRLCWPLVAPLFYSRVHCVCRVGSGAENHSDSSSLEEKESHTAEHSRQEDEIAVSGERCANISPCAKSVPILLLFILFKDIGSGYTWY